MPLARLVLLLLAASAAPAAAPAVPPPPRIEIYAMPQGVRLLVAPRVARAGAVVTLELVNGRRDQVGFNLCMSELRRYEHGGTTEVRQPGACTRELRIAGPGGRARHVKRLPAGLPPGRYSYATRVEAPLHGPQMHQLLVSEPFEVR